MMPSGSIDYAEVVKAALAVVKEELVAGVQAGVGPVRGGVADTREGRC